MAGALQPHGVPLFQKPVILPLEGPVIPGVDFGVHRRQVVGQPGSAFGGRQIVPGMVPLQLSRQVFLIAGRPGCRLLGAGECGGPGLDRAVFIRVIRRAVGRIGLIGLQRIRPLEVIPPAAGEHFGQCIISRRQSQLLFFGWNWGRHAPRGLRQKKLLPIGEERRQIRVFSVQRAAMDRLVQLLCPLLRFGDVSAGQSVTGILHRIVQCLYRRVNLPGLLPCRCSAALPGCRSSHLSLSRGCLGRRCLSRRPLPFSRIRHRSGDPRPLQIVPQLVHRRGLRSGCL